MEKRVFYYGKFKAQIVLVPISTNRNHQRDTAKYRRREKPKGAKNQKEAI